MNFLFFAAIILPSFSIIVPNKDCFLVNTIYNKGQSLARKMTSGPFECQEWCQLVRRCTHFTYLSESQTCSLRQGDRAEARTGAVSGPKYCPPSSLNQVAQKPVCSGNICLSGSTSRNAGNVMVDQMPICDDDWGLVDAAVVCRQLGFPGVERATKESEFGTVSSTYKMDNVGCRGNETFLEDCYHRAADDCDGNEAAGVVCASSAVNVPSQCKEKGKICLLGGEEGAGNVYHEGKPVCHNGWDYADASVVCRVLGFPGAMNFTIRSHFGLSSSYFRLSNVNCRGDESSLEECPHDIGADGCEADMVAGVVCIGSTAEKVNNISNNLAIILGVSLAVLLILIAVGLAVSWKRKNRKELQLKRSDSILPSISFKNPIVKTSAVVEDH